MSNSFKNKTDSLNDHGVSTRSKKMNIGAISTQSSSPSKSDLITAISNLQFTQTDILLPNKTLAESFSAEF